MNQPPLFYPALDIVIRRYLQDALRFFQYHYRHEHFYAVALGMMEDIGGFFIVGNTLERLAEQIKHRDEDDDDYWWISEWYGEEFTALGDLVHNVVTAIAEPLTSRDYTQFRLDYQDHILNVLADMREQGQLRNVQGEELWVWVQYVDAYDEAFDDISFSQLNAPHLTPLFIDRYQSQGDNLSRQLQQRMRQLQLLD